MQRTVSVLDYIAASLADAQNLMPDLSGLCRELSLDDILQGRLSELAARKMQAARKSKESRDTRVEEEKWPVRVTLFPLVYGRRAEHAELDKKLPEQIAPIFFNALLSPDGSLALDEKDCLPSIPRNLLEPTFLPVSIGALDDLDKARSQLPQQPDNWHALLKVTHDLLQQVSGYDWGTLEIEQYELQENAGIALADGNRGATQHIQALVGELRKDSGAQAKTPLLASLMEAAVQRPLLELEAQLDLGTEHLGQMESRYGLSDSQRESLAHFFALPDAVTAVDGPPGTGKTTLLLSVIASLWVRRALEKSEPPLIVASSTNNQAVVNILEAFAKVKEPAGELAGRWLDDVKSYGLYLPAKSRENNTFSFPVHMLKGMAKDSSYEAKSFETVEGLESARRGFLSKAQQALGELAAPTLESVAAALHARLKQRCDMITVVMRKLITLTRLCKGLPPTTERILALEQSTRALLESSQTNLERLIEQKKHWHAINLAWQQHCHDESWWIGLLSRLGITTSRRRRDELFRATVMQSHDWIAQHLLEMDLRQTFGGWLTERIKAIAHRKVQAQAEHDLHRKTMETLRELLSFLSDFCGKSKRLSLEGVQSALDVGPRFEAFKLATHYWEARYLMEVDALLKKYRKVEDSKSADRLELQYRRLAKLYPCSVATLHSLPSRYTGWSGVVQPMFGRMDLLIVDEAGQVPPEIGMPAFALAKRALVVGDVNQISPVHGLPASIDRSNAHRYGLLQAGWEGFRKTGMAASSGNVMQIAQQATPFAKHPQRGSGMFLCEHRRCWPEIIAISNALVYQNLLQPCRDDDGSRLFSPTLGYVHLAARDERVGKSRRNLVEAQAIARWLRRRRSEIEAAFASEGKQFGELVAVITPFAAQSHAVRRELDEHLGNGHGITVGTVHSLQGAERRLVIFSPTYGVGTAPGSTMFDKDYGSLLNVAVSRAQDAFLVFGNMHLFQPGHSNPASVMGRFLLENEKHELKDVDVELLTPSMGLAPTVLIRDLEGHRKILRSAFEGARRRLIIVSPYLSRSALKADAIEEQIRHACQRGVNVVVISNSRLAGSRKDFGECIDDLKAAGAKYCDSQGQCVHSKLLLVDEQWLTVGSFNWLSSLRVASDYRYHESSMRYDGEEAFVMIQRSLTDLRELIRPYSRGTTVH